MNDQQLYAAEAEQSVIGALLRRNDAIDHLGDLQAAHFYRDDHRAIFAEILRQIQAQRPCDVVTVGLALPQLPEVMRYLNDIAQAVPSAANVGRYADMVADRAMRRAMLATLDELDSLVRSPAQQDAQAVLDQALSKLQALASGRMRNEPVPVAQVLAAHTAILQERAEGRAMGLRWGFRDLDALFPAGMSGGKLVIVAARPSMGKSALAFNAAVHVAATDPVLVLSMEMDNSEQMDRILASQGRIPLEKVLDGEMSDAQWTGMTRAYECVGNLRLYMDDEPALTLRTVRNKARLVKRKHGLKMLVVDYVQLMGGDGDPSKKRYQQIEEISRGLKTLAKELDILVVALAQVNRNGANKSRPSLAELKDGAMEADADVVIFVHRDEVDNPQSHLRGYADVFVAKNRNGKVADVLMTYEGCYTQFGNADGPRPEDPSKATAAREDGLSRFLPRKR